MADDTGFLAGPFDQPAPLLFVGVEVQLPDAGWLRLLAGAGEVVMAGKTFVGEDATFGTMAELDAVQDGFGDDAPALRIGIAPPTTSAAAILAGQNMQGRTVLVWFGVIDRATGQAGTGTDAPVLIFAGEVDQGVLKVDRGSRAITLECVSIWERLFEDAEGVRLTNAYHQSAWPGELGFEFVTDVQRQLPWGSDTPRPDVVRDALYTRPT